MKRRFLLVALLSLAPVPWVLADGAPGADSSQSRCDSAVASASRDLDATVLAFDPEVVTITCHDSAIESLAFRLVPGGDSKLELNIRHRGEREALLRVRAVVPTLVEADFDGDFDGEFDANESPDWVGISPEGARLLPDRAVTVSVTVRADQRFEPGTAHHAWLEILVDDGTESAILPVTLNVLEESPLFRSRFEVDPVLGQFSYRPARARSNRIGISNPAAATGE